ncbi:MAG: PAS domain S-box protein [Firmicutes bacterium]|nr:PAS domain S-box protein [Bacillota bacterium]
MFNLLTGLNFNQRPQALCREVISSLCNNTDFDSGVVIDFTNNSVFCSQGISPSQIYKLDFEELAFDEFTVLSAASHPAGLDEFFVDLKVKTAVAFPLYNSGVIVGVCVLLSQAPVSDAESLQQAAKEASLVMSMALTRAGEQAEDPVFDCTLVENLPAMVWRSDNNGKMYYFNQSWLVFTGRTLEEEVADGWTKGVIHPDDFDTVIENYIGSLESRKPFRLEYRMRRHDGEYRWVADYGNACYNAAGDFAGYIGFCYDITEEKEAAQVIQNRHDVYRSLFKNNHAVMLLIDPETGRIVDANPAACKYYGYTKEELRDKKIQDINALSEAEVKQEMQRAAKFKRNHFSFQHYLANGELRDVEVYSGPIKHKNQEVLYSIIHDVTEEKRAIEELKMRSRENQRLANNVRLLLDSSGEGIIGVDHQGRCIFANQAACNMLQYTEGELLGKEMHITLHHSYPDGSDYPLKQCPIRGTLYTGKNVFIEDEVLWRKDGWAIDVRYSSCPMIENDIITGAVITFSDISEQKEMIAALEESEEFARSIANGLSAQVLVLDEDGNIIMANKVWQKQYYRRYSDASETDFIGRNYPDLCMQQVGLTGAKGIQRVLRGEQEEFTLEYAEELETETRWYFARVREFLGNGRVIVTHEDITEIVRSREAAEAANAAKSQFLANMSHEIRTPLNAIIGMTDLLWEQPMTAEQKKFVHVLRTAGDHLLSLINNVLDMARIEHGHLKLEESEFDLVSLVEDTLEFMAVSAHQKDLELNSHIPNDLARKRIGDANRLRQVLVNLIGNAIKFTEQGEVTLRVREGDTGHVSFELSDTGIGIPADKLENIFKDFAQVETSAKRNYGGTGLGLTISRRLAKLMGGTIVAKSEVGKGSTFTLTVHLPSLPQEDPAPALTACLDGPVLIIDDNSTNRVIVRELLAGQGVEVAEAENGSDGLKELARARAANNPYQLIVLDRWMPGMDGFQVAESIIDKGYAEQAPIMMLTSNQKLTDVERCRAMGISTYLSKPIKRNELFGAIKKVVTGNGQTSEVLDSAETAAPDVAGEKRLLLVDDSPDNLLLMQRFLQDADLIVDVGEDGVQAVDMFKKNKYDLVLMDIQMPNMDGLEATATIRQWEATHDMQPTPVIALTAYAFQEDIDKCLAAGCDAHLAKPVKKDKLLKFIADWLDND